MLAVFLVAFSFRSVIVATMPVLPDIQRELGLTYTNTGALSAIVLLILGLTAVPGALLTRILSLKTLVLVSTLGLSAMGFARLLYPATIWTYVGTAALTFCAGVGGPALITMIRQSFPNSVGSSMSIITVGFVFGAVLGTSLTPTLASNFGWRGTFVFWSAVVLVASCVWYVATPHVSLINGGSHAMFAAVVDGRAWYAGGLFAAQCVIFYTVAAWIPFLLLGSSALYASVVYAVLNGSQFLPLMFVALFMPTYASSRAFYLTAGFLCFLGVAGLVLPFMYSVWLFAALIGIGSSMLFAGSVAIPAVVASSEADVAALAGVVFTVGYLLSFAGPFVAGALVDAVGDPRAALVPPLLIAVMSMPLGLLANRMLVPRTVRGSATRVQL